MDLISKKLQVREIKKKPGGNNAVHYHGTSFGVLLADHQNEADRGMFAFQEYPSFAVTMMAEFETYGQYLSRIEILEKENQVLKQQLNELQSQFIPMKAYFDAKMEWDAITKQE